MGSECMVATMPWLAPRLLWHCVTWPIAQCDVTHCNSVTWLIAEHVPCHTLKWFMSHTGMSRVTHRNESCHTQEWAISQTGMSHVTHRKESCHTHERFASHVWMRQVTHMDESRDPLMRATWLIPVCHMTHSWVWHDSLICVTCLWVSHVTYE